MPADLAASLPSLLSRAVAWAETQAGIVLANGTQLSRPALQIARRVGVIKPENIRIGVVDGLPLPDDASLRELSHEFRHVYQYEAAGSIAAFLPVYLQQIVAFGYANAPFEADARAHE